MNVGKGSRQIGLVPSEDGLALRARGFKTPIAFVLAELWCASIMALCGITGNDGGLRL